MGRKQPLHTPILKQSILQHLQQITFVSSKDSSCFPRLSDHCMWQISKWRSSVAQKFNESWNCCNCSMWLRAQPLPVQNKPCADYSTTSSPLWIHTWSHTEVITILQIKWISKPWKLQREITWFLTVTASQLLKFRTKQLQYSKKAQCFLQSCPFKPKCWPPPTNFTESVNSHY